MAYLFNQNSCLREVRESQRAFSALVSFMEKSHKAVVTSIEERQTEEEKRVETMVEDLEREIEELMNKSTEQKCPDADEPCEDKKSGTLVSIWKTMHKQFYWDVCRHILMTEETRNCFLPMCLCFRTTLPPSAALS